MTMPSVQESADTLDDLRCACGYNLRGLSPEGRCPECGEDVAVAVRWRDHPFGGAAALKRMTLGLLIVIAAHGAWAVTLTWRGLLETVDRFAFVPVYPGRRRSWTSRRWSKPTRPVF